MSKQSKKKKIKTVSAPKPQKKKAVSWFGKESRFYWIIAVAAVALYFNTLSNQFALDDGLVLRDNKIVLKGVSGIPDILTHDSFYGTIGDSKNLSGGRYRPLSLVSYAIEISLFGVNARVHHLLNILFYALTCAVLLRFLNRFIFPQNEIAALIAAALFTIHPIHTEVVANIKSRDEIFSLLLLLLTIHYLLKFLNESKKSIHLLAAACFYFLALLSKENGLIFIIMIPLTVYFFSKEKRSGIVKYSAVFLAVAALYFAIRVAMIGLRNNNVPGVMDNPYVLADAEQKYATILFVFLNYLKLLFYPYPLTFDYSYAQVPYRSFTDPWVLIALVIYLLLGIYALIGFKSNNIISWCIIFYFGTIAIVSNILFNVGAPMAERFLYQASLPFVIVVTEVFRRIYAAAENHQPALRVAGISVMGIAAVWSAFLIQVRNKDWKTDETLFLHDVTVSTKSARANTYAGIALVRLCDAEKDSVAKRGKAQEALIFFRRSLVIKDDYMPTLLNMGVAYSRIDSGDAAEKVWAKAKSIEPENPNFSGYNNYLGIFFYNRGMRSGGLHDFEAAARDLEKATIYKPTDANAWYNLGGSYYMLKDYEKARRSWEKSLQLNPNLIQAKQGLMALPPATTGQ